MREKSRSSHLPALPVHPSPSCPPPASVEHTEIAGFLVVAEEPLPTPSIEGGSRHAPPRGRASAALRGWGLAQRQLYAPISDHDDLEPEPPAEPPYLTGSGPHRPRSLVADDAPSEARDDAAPRWRRLRRFLRTYISAVPAAGLTSDLRPHGCARSSSPAGSSRPSVRAACARARVRCPRGARGRDDLAARTPAAA